MSKSQDKKHPKSPPRKKKRRWLRRFAVLFVLLFVLALAINGPIARWLVGKILTDELAKLGVDGSVKVEGRLWSGFTLKEAKFDGGDSIVRLKFDELGVHYSLPELRDKKIRRVHGRGVEFEINLKEKTENTEEKEERPEFDTIVDSLQKIRPLLVPLELDLERFEITLNPADQEKDSLRFSFDALKHEAGRETFHLKKITSNVLGEKGLPAQDLALRWGANELRLGELKVLPALVVNNVEVSYPPGESLSVTASVAAGGADLGLAADESGRVEITMENGPLQVGQIVSAYDPDLRLDGTLSRLQVTAHNLWEETDNWTARIDLEGTDLKWPGGGGLSKLALRLTGDENMKLTLSAGTDLELAATAPRPDLKNRPLGDIWKDLPLTLSLKTGSLQQTMREVFAAIGPKQIELANIPEGALTIEGDLVTGGEFGIAPANLKWTFADIVYQEKKVPNLSGTAKLADGVAHASASLTQARQDESLVLNAKWVLESQDYEASLNLALPDPSWINPFVPGEGPTWRPTGPITLGWSGKGGFPKDQPARHAGDLKVSNLTLTAPEETTTEIALTGAYDWPGMVELASLSVRNGDLWLEGSTKWEGNKVTIATLRFHDERGPITSLSGHAPLSLDALTAEKYLAQTDPLSLKLEGHDLRLARIGKLVPLPLTPGTEATLSYNLALGGTPGAPTLNGVFSAKDVRYPNPANLPVLASSLTFATEARRLSATGSVTEPGGKIIDFDASLPLELKAIVKNPEHFKTLAITGNAHLKGFDLQRLLPFVPESAEAALAGAEGQINADVRVTGSIADPKLTGNATLQLDRYPLPDTPYRDVRDSKLVLRLEGSQVVIDPTTEINCAGGKINLSGSVEIGGEEPQFAIRLNADHLLAWRNDSFILRNNAQLRLDGPLSAARITGDVQFVESLFYKDIELIPIGVPTANVPKPRLPQIDQEKAAKIGGIPAPFGNWTLNVGVRTQDPINIRGGNFATGRVTANARVAGTIALPRPLGTVTIQDAWARLPLAGKLNLSQGIITLRPDAPYDPVLDLRGAATVDRYNIKLNIFGSANNPKYNLFADPPLPESEILTLLATGTTTGDLQALDKDAATMKGAQLAINWLKDKFQKPGKDNLFQRALAGLDEVELNVGENDPFSGRKLNSATMQVADNWFLSAAVDATGNTRGVVIFSVRFR